MQRLVSFFFCVLLAACGSLPPSVETQPVPTQGTGVCTRVLENVLKDGHIVFGVGQSTAPTNGYVSIFTLNARTGEFGVIQMNSSVPVSRWRECVKPYTVNWHSVEVPPRQRERVRAEDERPAVNKPKLGQGCIPYGGLADRLMQIGEKPLGRSHIPGTRHDFELWVNEKITELGGSSWTVVMYDAGETPGFELGCIMDFGTGFVRRTAAS